MLQTRTDQNFVHVIESTTFKYGSVIDEWLCMFGHQLATKQSMGEQHLTQAHTKMINYLLFL